MGFYPGQLSSAIEMLLQMQGLGGIIPIGVGGLGLRGLACHYTRDLDIVSKRAMWRS